MALNPIRSTRKLVGALAIDPDEDDEPERWDEPSRVSKALTPLKRYPFLSAAIAFFLVALLLFLVPVLPSAHRSGALLTAGVFAVGVTGAYAQGRRTAYQTLQDYDLNVLFTGRGIRARIGQFDGDIDDRLTGFKVLKKFSLGGLSTKYEQFRDRYGRKDISEHKEKYHRVDDDGSGEVRRGLLKNTTFSAGQLEYGVDLFNSVSVTHAGTEEERLSSKDFDTVATIAPVLDTRTSAQVESAFRAESTARRHADDELQQLEDYMDRLEEYVDPAGQPLFERLTQMIRDEREARNSDGSRENSRRNGQKEANR